jgi:glycine/D-amino acid oxidase-like deaminating enzyme
MINADLVVLASGFETTAICKDMLGIRIPITPLKGYTIDIDDTKNRGVNGVIMFEDLKQWVNFYAPGKIRGVNFAELAGC